MASSPSSSSSLEDEKQLKSLQVVWANNVEVDSSVEKRLAAAAAADDDDDGTEKIIGCLFRNSIFKKLFFKKKSFLFFVLTMKSKEF